MKSLIIVFALVTAILLTIIFLGTTELRDIIRTQQSEIQGLREANEKQVDSLNHVLKVTKDSLEYAFNTIRQANAESIIAHEKSQKEIKKLRGIVYVKYESDSARMNALKELYKSYTP